MPEKSDGKRIALITGANKGIGFEVARQLGAVGYLVLLGARDTGRGQEAAKRLQATGATVEPLTIDVNNEASIRAAAEVVREQYGRLDVLVNNAGIADLGADGAPSTVQLDVLERTLRTNLYGPIAVTQAMLPLLRKSPAGRIVNVSSGLGSLTQNADPNWAFAGIKPLGYNTSKAALNMFTIHLAWELRDTPIKVNAADPGYTATDMNGNQGTQTIEEGSEAIVRLAQVPADGPTGGYFDRHGVVPW